MCGHSITKLNNKDMSAKTQRTRIKTPKAILVRRNGEVSNRWYVQSTYRVSRRFSSQESLERQRIADILVKNIKPVSIDLGINKLDEMFKGGIPAGKISMFR